VPSGAFSSTTFSVEAKRLARYFGVGGAAACVDIGLFMLFAGWLGLPYLRVAACSFILATLVNYVLSVRFVFVSGQRYSRRWEIVLVYVVSGIGLAVNQLVLWAAVDLLHWYLLFGKLLATGTVFVWNYASRRAFIFGAMHD
jgi:putative flippase GtrA